LSNYFATARSGRCTRHCLYNLGLYELGLDAGELLPPMKPEQASLRTENAGAKAQ